MDSLKKFVIGTIVFIAALGVINKVYAEAQEVKVKYLVGKVGAAEVYITNKPCNIAPFKDKWPYAAFVVNETMRKYQEGCFGPVTIKGEELIHIQWTEDDYSELPANLFLQPHSFPRGNTEPPKEKPKPKLKPELEV